MVRTSLILSLIAMGASSCAWTAQKAALRPQVSVQAADLGGGANVYVHTVDERESDVLGNRGAGAIGAQISTSSAEIVAVVDQSLTSGLHSLGFATTPQPSGEAAELRVEVRALHYKITTGFWAGALDVDAALKAICIHGQERGHEELHRGNYDDSIQVVPTASSNDEYINKALSSAINEVLHDRPLMDCLARRGQSPSAGPASAAR